jgi:lauroyl/myristoyl acyltransferase
MSRAGKPHFEKLFYRVMYTPRVFELTSRLFPFLNRSIFRAVARSVAWAYAVTQHGVRRVVRDNLSLLSDQPATDRDAIRTFENFGTAIADYVAVGNMEPDRAASLCISTEGLEHLKNARASGRGAVLATGHFGFFEFGALLLGRMGHPVTVVTWSEPTKELTAWRAAFRRRWGAETIEIGTDAFSSLQVVRALAAGRFTALLADRPHDDHAIEVALPGGKIRFSLSPALLAFMADAPIIPVAVAGDFGGYRLVAKPPIRPREMGEDRQSCVEAATRALADSLFEEIRRDPLQWYQFVPVRI